MQVDQIERTKRQYTDKYVVVDPARPELARFKDLVGQVKTVNMSGRALVEFMDYHLNIGWYDIDPEFLKVVDKPPPKVEKPAAKKPPAKAEAKPPAAAKPAAAKAPAAGAKPGKASVADILAAARAGKAGAAKSAGEAASGEAALAAGTAKAKPATPVTAKPAAPAKVDRSKMSVAEMLAAARAGGAGGVVQAKIQSESRPAADALPPTGEPASAGGKQPTESIVTPTEKVDRSKMTIDDILAWCRAHDAK